LRRGILRARGHTGRAGWLLKRVQRVLHRQVRQFHLPLLNPVVLRQNAQLTYFSSHDFNGQVLGFHHGTTLTLKGDQAGTVVVPLVYAYQGQLRIEDQLVVVAAAPQG
jgi:hypothetical protein